MRLNDRPTRRVLLAMLTDDPERDGGWLDERQICANAGLRPLRAHTALRGLVETGAVERVVNGDLEVYFRLSGTGLVRALWASRWLVARLLAWWYRGRAHG